MKSLIETNKNFTFRLEDILYSLIGFGIALIGLFAFLIIKANQNVGSNIASNIFIIVLVIATLTSSYLIFSSFKQRKKENYYFDKDKVVKMINEKIVFELDIVKIVSIRVNNKYGKQGTIIFMTNEASRNYFFTYTPINMTIPLVLYGLTSLKINMVKDRKEVLSKIVKANPKIVFIETY